MEVLGIGVAVRDIAVRLSAFPEPDHKYPAKELFEVGGGPVPTALVTLSRLGRRVAFAGVVGHDAAGRLVAESLRSLRSGSAVEAAKFANAAAAWRRARATGPSSGTRAACPFLARAG